MIRLAPPTIGSPASVGARGAPGPVLRAAAFCVWKVKTDESAEPAERSDALVLFGATGDLHTRRSSLRLQAMVKRGDLDVPVIGVAKSDFRLEDLRTRVRASLEAFGGGADPSAFARLSRLLRYVDGDYHDQATWAALHAALGPAVRPLHYLAIPPSMFPTVIEGLGRSGSGRRPTHGCTRARRLGSRCLACAAASV